jgi:hypothetical protein
MRKLKGDQISSSQSQKGFNVSKYSDEFMLWLKDEGYTHCFYLSGGNVMHLLESASQNFVCVPFVHEVGAGIAADYFNEIALDGHRNCRGLDRQPRALGYWRASKSF